MGFQKCEFDNSSHPGTRFPARKPPKANSYSIAQAVVCFKHATPVALLAQGSFAVCIVASLIAWTSARECRRTRAPLLKMQQPLFSSCPEPVHAWMWLSQGRQGLHAKQAKRHCFVVPRSSFEQPWVFQCSPRRAQMAPPSVSPTGGVGQCPVVPKKCAPRVELEWSSSSPISSFVHTSLMVGRPGSSWRKQCHSRMGKSPCSHVGIFSQLEVVATAWASWPRGRILCVRSPEHRCHREACAPVACSPGA